MTVKVVEVLQKVMAVTKVTEFQEVKGARKNTEVGEEKGCSIGIITFYGQQKEKLKARYDQIWMGDLLYLSMFLFHCLMS